MCHKKPVENMETAGVQTSRSQNCGNWLVPPEKLRFVPAAQHEEEKIIAPVLYRCFLHQYD